MPEHYNITLTRGDSYSLAVRWTDSEAEPIDIDSARLQVRRSLTSSSTLLSVASDGPDAGDSLTIDDNEVQLTLTPELTADLTSGVYDLEATSTGGQVKTLISGRFIVERDVTHD